MRQKTGNSISGSMKLDQQRLNSVSDRKQMPVFCVFTRKKNKKNAALCSSVFQGNI
jgi:hypothetical protein